MLDEEAIDMYLAREAIRKGWAETKLILAARILKKVLQYEADAEKRKMLKAVIEYLETFEIEKTTVE